MIFFIIIYIYIYKYIIMSYKITFNKYIAFAFIILFINIVFIFCLINYYIKTQSNKIYEIISNEKVYEVTIKEKKNIELTILKKVVKICDKLKIQCFLSSGTCLGYYRENDFIDYDYDIDIGIPINQYKEEIINEMINEGFVHYRTLGDIENGLEESFRLPNTKLGPFAKVDIFPHYIETDNKNNKYYTWYSYKSPEFIEKIKYRVPYFKLKKINFKGIDVCVPDPTEEYLINHYGNDWNIPKKAGIDYHYSTSPNSIVK
jgi:hypothetical protein